MYIDATGFTYYTSDGSQAHTRAPFLLLGSSSREREESGNETIYAAIRSVSLRQFGHFMMGSARVDGFTFSVSGAFGNDGLPNDFASFGVRSPGATDHLGRVTDYRYLSYEESAPIRSRFVKLPPELTEAFWKSGDNIDPITLGKIVSTVRAAESPAIGSQAWIRRHYGDRLFNAWRAEREHPQAPDQASETTSQAGSK